MHSSKGSRACGSRRRKHSHPHTVISNRQAATNMSATLCSLLPPCAVLSLIASCVVLVLLHFDSYQASLQSAARHLREGAVPRDLSLYVELFRAADAVKPVKVNVYVEALCIDSKAYFESQLVPTFATLGTMIMDLDVVVFGNAKLSQNDTNGVQCQHGPGTVQASLFLLMCVRMMRLITWPFRRFIYLRFDNNTTHSDEPNCSTISNSRVRRQFLCSMRIRCLRRHPWPIRSIRRVSFRSIAHGIPVD
jgi:hypothetical protein